MYYRTSYSSPLGRLLLASDGEALSGLWFEGQKHIPSSFWQDSQPCHELSLFRIAARWLDSYFSGSPSLSLPPLKLAGSAFQQKVWSRLLLIPYGTTITYGEIARELSAPTGRPLSAQAVGGAVSHNPIAILIPCHRVMGAGGRLTGYAGGIEVKKRLLSLEGMDISLFTDPEQPYGTRPAQP